MLRQQLLIGRKQDAACAEELLRHATFEQQRVSDQRVGCDRPDGPH